MANLNIDLPSFSDVDDQKQRKQIKDYLFSLNEQLRYVLSHLGTDNFTDDVKNAIESTVALSDTVSKEIALLTESGSTLKSKITQTAEEISSEVSRASIAEGSLSSRITQTAEEISTKVSATDYNGATLVSMINQTAEAIQIIASKIRLEGYTSINGGFNIDVDGSLYTTGDMVVQRIYSQGGTYISYYDDFGITVRMVSDNSLCAQIYGSLIFAKSMACDFFTIGGESVADYVANRHSHSSVSYGSYTAYISSNGNFASGNGGNLGASSQRWGVIYLSSSPDVSSDRNAKHDIADLENVYKQIVLKCRPVQYKYNNGTSDRYHTGFIAQDIETLLEELGISTQDFAGFVKSPTYAVIKDGGYDTTSEITGYIYSLRYEEFISPAVAVIQEQQKEIDSMKTELAQIKEILAKNNIV